MKFRLLTLRQASKVAGRSRPVLLQYIKRRKLRAVAVRRGIRGKAYLVTEADLKNLFKRKCLWCKKTFEAKPLSKKFCCDSHSRKYRDLAVLKRKKKK